MFQKSVFWATLVAMLPLSLAKAQETKKPEKKAPIVEVVFCLDTTGSMGGLLEGAKQKIWSMVNQIAGGKPTPELRIGLVAYRDKGDNYVTQITDLTDDLDSIHGKLKEFRAQGGGDFPEHVNQALDDAVNKIKWSKEKNTLRVIYLVGDAPPHMDYTDDVKYPDTCKKAKELGIIINAVQCGNNADTTKSFTDIAEKGGGAFVVIPQDGGTQVVSTPFDKRLGELSVEIASTNIYYGDEKAQLKAENARKDAIALPAAPPAAGGGVGAAAERVAGLAKMGKVAANDLIQDMAAGKIKLSDIKENELPAELKKLDEKARVEYIEKQAKKRQELQKEALELDAKRTEFIKKKLEEEKAKGKGKDSFDTKVLEILRDQAKKVGIDY